MRTWSANAGSPGLLLVGLSWPIEPAYNGTPEIIYELPAIAQIAQITIVVDNPADSSAHVDVAAATTSPATFADAGSIAFATTGNSVSATFAKPVSARWLRLRFNRRRGAAFRVDTLAATGSLSVPAAPLAGRWAISENQSGLGGDRIFPDSAGSITANAAPVLNEPEAATYDRAGEFSGGSCNRDRGMWHAPIRGGSVDLGGGDGLQAVAGGSLLVGMIRGGAFLARRISHAPQCDLPDKGRGPELLVIKRYPRDIKDTPLYRPGHLVRTLFLPALDASDLGAAQVAILEHNCTADADLSTGQQRALLAFVERGHVLIVRDADICATSSYQFIPYPFTTKATGAAGSRGSTLFIADSSVLGSTERSDRAHFVDVRAYLANPQQQIGDSDLMKTTDPHWCGLMFAENATGAKGWVHAYARYGRGVIVFNGFDVDNSLAKIPEALLISQLEYDLSPRGDLPCSARVADALLIFSSASRTVPFGRATNLRFHFRVEQEEAVRARRVTMSLSPRTAHGLQGRLDRGAFTLTAAPQPVNVEVHVPANIPAGSYLVTLTASGDRGESVHASMTISVDEALAKTLEKGGRARIYGIHFDVASATIQARSEATIREIAQVLREHPGWRMRVEGYTDSDGGAAYNKTLSDKRAQAVVADLTKRYAIARGRLSAAGYGMGRPVAPNSTDAGKALNRRVELVRL